ncbi:zinc ABC transporter ATP-binding protein ZnuC [Rodentibacter caecimuris]|uniref:Zinc ABC transporter ATP-binding protein ZnuC n=1 Tax=Rodentibacter caecimuris TaxID=1796644 RepID=A0ABX3KWB9_9PAST|nr:zinc ABC transporter ATP-binding protein ZnuC [Rodentibacter heylii]
MQIHSIQVSEKKSPLIELKNITVKFGEKTALQNINLSIFPDSTITIVGPNGGGKSTLLKTLLKLQKPTDGQVIYHQNVQIGYVPQKIYLDANLPLTVERFLLLKPGCAKTDIETVLAQLSITHLKQNALQKLSGGEMQRVLLARAILNKPNLLILDEPTQGVDINGQAELYQLIKQTQKILNCAILMVSHDLHIVLADSKEVICINGHICCAGTPESLSNDPKFTHLWGNQITQNIAFYAHHHNHRHNLHGDVCCSQTFHSKNCTHQNKQNKV